MAVGVSSGGRGGSARGEINVSAGQGACLRLKSWIACQLTQSQQGVAGMMPGRGSLWSTMLSAQLTIF